MVSFSFTEVNFSSDSWIGIELQSVTRRKSAFGVCPGKIIENMSVVWFL